MKAIILIIFNILALNVMSFAQADSAKFRSLDPYEFHLQYLREDPALLIDVREFFEFKGKRIRGAVNIPASGNLLRVADTLNKEYALFLYCTSGSRSDRAAQMLYDKGFRKLYSLKGGFIEWRREGMKVDKSRVRKKKHRAQGAEHKAQNIE